MQIASENVRQSKEWPGILRFRHCFADAHTMTIKRSGQKVERCVYVEACYLAEELRCFGYKTDCPLFQESTGELYNEARFNEAMDKLIKKTVAKYQQDKT